MAASLQQMFGYDAELVASSGGVFEITVDGTLIFSKNSLDRFPADNEIEDLIKARQA